MPFLICPFGPGWFSLWFGKNARGFSFFAEWQDDEREQWIGEAGCRERPVGVWRLAVKLGGLFAFMGRRWVCVVPWTPATPQVQVLWWGMGSDIRIQPHHSQLRKRSLEIFSIGQKVLGFCSLGNTVGWESPVSTPYSATPRPSLVRLIGSGQS